MLISYTRLTANIEKAWRPAWLRMRRQVYRAVPPPWTVIVLVDRGLQARWLFQWITRLGWHPFRRINTGGTFRPAEWPGVPLKTLVPQAGCQWSGTGVAFKGRQRRLRGTLLARWEPGYQDPWLILTELPPTVGEVAWYGWRAWKATPHPNPPTIGEGVFDFIFCCRPVDDHTVAVNIGAYLLEPRAITKA